MFVLLRGSVAVLVVVLVVILVLVVIVLMTAVGAGEHPRQVDAYVDPREPGEFRNLRHDQIDVRHLEVEVEIPLHLDVNRRLRRRGRYDRLFRLRRS